MKLLKNQRALEIRIDEIGGKSRKFAGLLGNQTEQI